MGRVGFPARSTAPEPRSTGQDAGHRPPDDIEPRLVVAVDEPVAHADDLTPGDIRLCCPERGRDLACRLANHFQ
jgi:hypothetical protein